MQQISRAPCLMDDGSAYVQIFIVILVFSFLVIASVLLLKIIVCSLLLATLGRPCGYQRKIHNIVNARAASHVLMFC